MGVKLCPDFWSPQVDANAATYSGAKLFCYAAGGSTKQATYTDSTGGVAQTNPIIFNAKGVPDDPPWLTEGVTYKFVLAPSTDTDPPTSPIGSWDNIEGINDVTVSLSLDQWTAFSGTPTFISTTKFSVTGDQTTELHVGRRLKITQSSGTVYAAITVSTYTSLTTITVSVDSGGVLDSGISAVSYGVMSAVNTSFPRQVVITESIVDDEVTTAKIPNDAISLAKMAGGTTGHLISYDSSGDPQTEVYTYRVKHSTIDLTNSGADDTAAWTFSSIPANATKLELRITNASLSGNDDYDLLIGDAGGLETTGYVGRLVRVFGASKVTSVTRFNLTSATAAADVTNIEAYLDIADAATFLWSINATSGDGGDTYLCDGTKALSAALTQIQIKSTGSNNFDAGTATLWYYGNPDIA